MRLLIDGKKSKMKSIFIRTDASPDIGVGHLMRCLTAADWLIKSQFASDVTFLCNYNLPEELKTVIHEKGFDSAYIYNTNSGSFNTESDADQSITYLQSKQAYWLIIDHYQIDISWETKVRPYVKRILVIDDLANRKHDCDVLLDQNISPNLCYRYIDLVPRTCQLLLGPKYLLLRPAFYSVIPTIKTKPKQVLVNFGGSDPTHEIEKVIQSIKKYGYCFKNLHFHIVAGPANKRAGEIEKLCESIDQIIYYKEAPLEELLLQSDFAIGAGGISLWERCALGVPSAVIVVADNQAELANEAEGLGLIWNLGYHRDVNPESIAEFIQYLLASGMEFQQKSKKCLDYMKPLISQKEHPIITTIKENS